MNKHGIWVRACAGVAVALLMIVASGAQADPPARVVRLGYITGQVSFLPAGASDWVQAELNRPLWIGDRLWTAADARAELQMGNSSLHVAPGTSVSIIAFDDRREQYEVTEGTVRLHVRSMDRDDAVEVDTPNLAFAIRSPGEYRVDVGDDATTVAVIRGSAEAFGTQNAYAIDAGRRIRFTGTDLGNYEAVALRADPFDSWAGERIALKDRSTSARYVAPDVIGYADLDAHGTWRQVPNYGSVWVPTAVAPDWAPYRYGRWTWVDPWGWTWVDDAPWGFAPFHYGRWAFVESRWCWVPGPRTVRPVYAPALVAFVGGPSLGVSVSVGGAAGVAWFPLAPGEVYRPAYSASRDYFTRVNVTNTVVNVTQVTNIYNNPTRVDVRYANVERANAVTAVPTQAFVEAQPVHRAAVKLEPQAIQRAAVVATPPVAPVKASIVAAPPAQAHPAPAVTGRTVIAKNAPPPQPAPIEQRQQALQRQPGKPLDAAELQKLAAPPASAARANVKVVQPTTPPKPLPATAEKEAPPQTARLQNNAPTPTPQRPGQLPNGEKETPQPPVNARPGSEARSQPVPPAPGAKESPPPQTATARPEATPRPSAPPGRDREPLQRPQGPQGEPERVAPPSQAAPTPPQAAPPESAAKAQPRRPEPAPPSRPETANAPPQPPRPEMSKAQPRRQPEATPPPRPETANAPPPAPPSETAKAQPRRQPEAAPPPRPEGANAPPPPPRPEMSRAQPPVPPPQRPDTANAPARPLPREATEPARQQATAPAPTPPEGRAPPAETPRQTEKAPAPRGGEKGKGNDREKDNKNDEK